MTFIRGTTRDLRTIGSLFLLCSLLHPHPLHSQGQAADILTSIDSIAQVGEELYYNVTYGGLDIGQLHFTVVAKGGTKNDAYVVARGLIDSYKGVPFVNVHTVYEDHITDGLFSEWFFSRTKRDNRWFTSTYRFDYTKGMLYIDRGLWKSDHPSRSDTIRIDTLYQDGLSLLYFARKSMIPGTQYRIPSYVSEKKGYTTLDILKEREHETIDAVSYPVDLIHCKGEAGFIGVFGFSGDFDGWFSNDAAHIPVIAKLKVLIGNIRIELMKWKHPGWNPPRYIEGDK